MRRILFMMPVLVATVAAAQTMTEVGASAAGSAIGSAAGKKVSDGITAIFGKVDKATGESREGLRRTIRRLRRCWTSDRERRRLQEARASPFLLRRRRRASGERGKTGGYGSFAGNCASSATSAASSAAGHRG